MAYINGAPEPFPIPAQDGDYTPGIYAIIEWQDGSNLTFAQYADTLSASAVSSAVWARAPILIAAV